MWTGPLHSPQERSSCNTRWIQNTSPSRWSWHGEEWQKEEVAAYAAAGFSSYGDRLSAIETTLGLSTSPTALKGLLTVLSLLGTRSGSLILTQSVTTFPERSIQEREALLLSRLSKIPGTLNIDTVCESLALAERAEVPDDIALLVVTRGQ